MGGLGRRRRRARPAQSVPEDALANETTRRLIRFENARVDASRYDRAGGLPSLDMLFSYANAQEGEFRAKMEYYNSMYNINSALMLTISLPTLFVAGAADIDEDNWKFRVIIYLLAASSAAFILSLQLTMSWVTSGCTFIADDLDALAFTSHYYPAAIGAPYVIGVLLMTTSIVFFICDLLASTDVADRYVISTIFGILIYATFTNPTYEWAYIFKKLIEPPQMFWDADGVDTVTAAVEHANAPKGKKLFTTAGTAAGLYSRKYDRKSDAFKPHPNAAADTHKTWVSVNDKCKLVVRGDLHDEEDQGFTTNLQDKLDYMRQYYDVPAKDIEPNIVVLQYGFMWFVSKVFTNGSAVVDNPAYISWLFTWQLKPGWAVKLEGHIHPDTIPLRKRTASYDQGAPRQDSTVINQETELSGFGGFGGDGDGGESAVERLTTWPEICDAVVDSEQTGVSTAQFVDKLRGITPAEFSGMTFANRLLALEELGIDDPAIRVKICNQLGGITDAEAPDAPEERGGPGATGASGCTVETVDALPLDQLGFHL